MTDAKQPVDATMPDVDLDPEEVRKVKQGKRGKDPVTTEEDRPSWVASILRGEQETPSLSLSPGFQVPGTRYQIIEWLGDGGMGVVYEAEHLDLQRRVALKVIREKYCRDPELKNMFRAEARAASRVGSENIVQIYDFSELGDGRLAFAMELLRGPLLRSEVRKEPLDIGRTVGILRQLCKGLAAAHEAGVIHRDVKPGNVVLAEHKGREDTVKILDFGIASILSDGNAGTDRGGTPLYVAPELIEGLAADARSDMYSLGCTAFEMLTGRTPFRGANAKEVLLAHLEDPPPNVRDFRPEVHRSLAAVIDRCLAKVPGDRFEDMRDLEASLCEAQCDASLATSWDHLPLPAVSEARQEKLLRRMPDPRGRRRGRAWVPAAIVGGIAAVAIASVLAFSGGSAELSEIEQLTLEAHAAAAEAYWVYPPAEDPKRPTAFTHVLGLEALDDRDADAAAKELRSEFASTLARLGDEYWERPGGKPFAIDFYVQVLVFEPEHAAASERARMSPGQLASLQAKAEDQSFSEDELIAVEPLAALAEDNPEERDRKLAKLGSSGREVAASTQAHLEQLTGTKPGADAGPAPVPPEPPPEPVDAEGGDETGDLVVDGDETGGTDDLVEGGEAPPVAPSGKRDKGKARKLAKRGTAALRSGNSQEATDLFQKALAADDRNPEALIGLSRVHFDKGSYATAVRYARKAVRLAPKKGDYRIRLGDAYYKAFKYSAARKEYEAAKKLKHPEAKSRLAKVEGKG